MKILSFFIVLLSISLTHAMTPDEISRIVEERAPVIKMFAEQQVASESDIRQSRLYGNPVLTYQGGQLKSGDSRGSVNDITLMQPIPWPGKRDANIKNQQFLGQISKLSLEEVKIALSHKVYLLAYELASNVEIEAHNKERRERFALISKYLGSRPLASPKQILDKDLIFSQLRVVEKSMNEATARKKSLQRELQILSGLPDININVDWKNIPKRHDKNFYENEYVNGIRFKKVREEIKIGENSIESARLAARPDIMVGVNYRQENTNPANHFYHGQVSVVIPIIDHGQHSVQSAKARLRRTEAESKLLDQEMRAELEALYENSEASAKNLNIFPLSLKDESEVRFKKAEDAFRKGQIDVMTFLQSDNQIHENVHLIYTSRLEYLQSLSQLELLVSHRMERE